MKTQSSSGSRFRTLLKGASAFVMTAIAFAAIPAIPASAAGYGLKVAGIEVTELNKNNILESDANLFKYNASTKTLTIKTSYYTYSGSEPIVESHVKGLTILMDDEDLDLVCTNTSAYGFLLYGDTTIKTSDPSNQSYLTGGKYGIYIVDGDLTVDNVDYLYVNNNNASGYAISGGGEHEKFIVKNSGMHVKSLSENKSGISNFETITLEDCGLEEGNEIRNGSVYLDAEHGNKVDNNFYINKRYLKIAGVSMTAQNQNNILGNGVFSYDSAANALKINGNYTYQVDGGAAQYFIESNYPNLTVNVTANSKLTDKSSGYGMKFYKDTTFTGNGKLEYNRQISASENLTFKNANVTVNDEGGTNNYGIYCGKNMTAENSILDITHENIGAMYVEGLFKYEGLSIVTEDIYWNGYEFVNDDNTESMPHARLVPRYNLKVLDKYVNYDNKSNILGNGALSYDPASKVLNIKGNLTQNTSSNYFIESFIPDLTVRINGSYTWTVPCQELFRFRENTTVAGGSLKWACIENPNYYGITTADNATLLTLKDTKLDLSTRYYTLYDHSYVAKLVIDGTDLTAKSRWDYAFEGFKGGIELKNCQITNPAAAYIDNVGGTIWEDPMKRKEAQEVTIAALTKITNQPVDVLGTIGTNAKFTVTAAGTGTLSYQWQFLDNGAWKDSGMTGAKTATLTVPITAARNGQKYRCVVKCGSTTVASDAATLKVQTAITTQPATQMVTAGTVVKFTVAASGAGTLSYQWQFFSGNAWTNSGMTGAKTATLSVEATDARDGQQYRCIVTSNNGTSATSSAASIKLKPVVTKQPVSYTGKVGDTAKFTVAATGKGTLTYQWQYYTGNYWANSGMTGSHTTTLSVPVTAERNGQQYRCLITSPNGAFTYSNAVSLNLNLAIKTQPTTQTLAIGSNAKFTVAASGDSLTYQWQFLSGSTWKNSGMTGATTATLTVPVTAERDGQQYRCVVKSGSASVTSNAASIKVKAAITKQPTNQGGAIDSTVKFTVTASGTNLSYQWQFLDNGAWKNSGMTGAKTATLSVPVTAARNGQQYRCVVTSANGTSATSNAAKLMVAPKITTQPQNYTGAVNTTAKFTVGASAGVSGVTLTYQWQFLDNGVWKDSGMTGAKTATLSVPVTTARNGQQYRCVVSSSNGTSTASNAAVLKVGSGITGQPQNVTAKIGTTAKFTVTVSGSATYQWQFYSSTGWQNSGMTGAQTATISVPVTAERDGQKYRCVVKVNGTTLTSNEASLKVQAAITAQPQSVSAAIGSTAKFTVTASGKNLTYQWQFLSTTGWKNSGMTGAQTATISVPVTADRNGQQYRCVVTSANGTSATSNAATLTAK